jgi:TPR repeat protein
MHFLGIGTFESC